MGGRTSVGNGVGKRTAWSTIKHSNNTKGWGVTPVPFSFRGANATEFKRTVFISRTFAQVGEFQVLGCTATVDTDITQDAANGWRFQLRNGGTDGADTDNLSASGYSTLTADDGTITALTPFTIPVEGPDNATPTKVFIGEGEVLQVVGLKLGAGQDASTTTFDGILYLLASPPGVSGTP